MVFGAGSEGFGFPAMVDGGDGFRFVTESNLWLRVNLLDIGLLLSEESLRLRLEENGTPV